MEKERTTDSSAVDLYLKDLRKNDRLLTADEEKHYAALAQQGDVKARNILIECNLRLVVKIARRFIDRGVSFEDLISEGNLGMIHAIEKFDPELGFRFTTYCSNWIVDACDRAVMNQNDAVRKPVYLQKVYRSILRAKDKLKARLHREPTVAEISAEVCIPGNEILDQFSWNQNSCSLNEPFEEDEDASLIDMITSGDDAYDVVADDDQKEKLEETIRKFTPRQQTAIALKFGLFNNNDCNLDKVGKCLGISREGARQLQVKAIERARIRVEEFV